jgi:hypothetical protein
MPRGATEIIFVRLFTGTRVQLLSPRQRDQSDKGFVDWKFMSVLSWGEQPSGTWLLDIVDEVRKATRSSLLQAHLNQMGPNRAFRFKLNSDLTEGEDGINWNLIENRRAISSYKS